MHALELAAPPASPPPSVLPRQELLARNFSLTILGKAAGPSDSSLVTIPPRLLADGLVRHYEYLPFQVGRASRWACNGACCMRGADDEG